MSIITKIQKIADGELLQFVSDDGGGNDVFQLVPPGKIWLRGVNDSKPNPKFVFEGVGQFPFKRIIDFAHLRDSGDSAYADVATAVSSMATLLGPGAGGGGGASTIPNIHGANYRHITADITDLKTEVAAGDFLMCEDVMVGLIEWDGTNLAENFYFWIHNGGSSDNVEINCGISNIHTTPSGNPQSSDQLIIPPGRTAFCRRNDQAGHLNGILAMFL